MCLQLGEHVFSVVNAPGQPLNFFFTFSKLILHRFDARPELMRSNLAHDSPPNGFSTANVVQRQLIDSLALRISPGPGPVAPPTVKS